MNSLPLEKNKNKSVQSRSGPYRVMLVDDSPVIRGLLTRWLEADPAIELVGSAANGQAALNSLDRIDPEIIVLDIEMPVMDGWQFLEAFNILFRQEEKEKIVIAVLTANGCEEVTYKALSNPQVKECLHKPLSDINFRSIIQSYFYD